MQSRRSEVPQNEVWVLNKGTTRKLSKKKKGTTRHVPWGIKYELNPKHSP